MTKMWYYPTSKYIGEIMHEGAIKPPVTGNLDDKHPCIWLTSNPDYIEPPDAIFIDRRGFHGMPGDKIIPVRVIVLIKSKLKNWYDYKAIANIPEQELLNLEDYAKSDGIDLSEWYFLERQIPITEFYEIEYWNQGIWVEYPPPNKPSVRHKA